MVVGDSDSGGCEVLVIGGAEVITTKAPGEERNTMYRIGVSSTGEAKFLPSSAMFAGRFVARTGSSVFAQFDTGYPVLVGGRQLHSGVGGTDDYQGVWRCKPGGALKGTHRVVHADHGRRAYAAYTSSRHFFLVWGGVYNQVQTLPHALSLQNHEFMVVCPADDDTFRGDWSAERIVPYPTPRSGTTMVVVRDDGELVVCLVGGMTGSIWPIRAEEQSSHAHLSLDL